MKECPMCGELLRLDVREIREAIPGHSGTVVRVRREWICPECDFFEEAEAGEG
jgi:transposase